MWIPLTSPEPQPGVRKVADPLSQIQLEANLGSSHKQKQFTSLINITGSLAREVLRAQVGRVCFGRDLLHRQLVVTDRLLEPQVLHLDVLYFAQARSAYYGQCRTGVDVQPNRDGSTQVFGKRLNSHRLSGAAAASVQFCFGGAGGHNALLLRPSLDQVLPVQDHAPANRCSLIVCLPPNPRQQGRAMHLDELATQTDAQLVAFQRETHSPSSCHSGLVRLAKTSLSTVSWWRT